MARRIRARWPQLLLVTIVVLLGFVLVRQAEPRVIGDGGEYVAMAWQLSRGQLPALDPEDMELYNRHINDQSEQFYVGQGTPGCCVLRLEEFRSGGRYDLPHFWLYPLFAAPFEGMARFLDVADTYAFFGLHLVLLAVVASAVARRAGPWAGAVVVLSPMLYWLDKPHSEIFIFSAIALALCWHEDRPELGVISLAFAGSQNLALAPLLPLYVLAVLVRRGWSWISPRTLAAITLAGAVVAIHPVYYLLRLGVLDPQSLLGDQRFRIPTATKLFTPVVDPYVGLLPWWPALFVLVVLSAAVGFHRARNQRRQPSMNSILPAALLGSMVLIALFGAAQNLNSNHGATFAMSRYSTWVAPFAIPALIRLHRWSAPLDRTIVAGVALVSVAFSVAVARPALRDGPAIFRPTYASTLLFQHVPFLYDPLPEVFIEREAAVPTDDKAALPAATRGCTKVLLHLGQWPSPCPRPSVVPEACLEARFCYASRWADGRYTYSTVDELS